MSVTASDQDGGVSAPVIQSIGVALAALQPNFQNPALMDLAWAGSSGSDQVQFTQLSPDTIRVTETQYGGTAVNNVQVLHGVTGRVIATGVGGDDLLDARGLSAMPATLDGGGGNNTLYGGNGGDLLIGGANGAESKQGNNVIIAGNGDNTIYGNSPTVMKSTTGGNNLIIGGTGHDVIYGNFGTNTLTSNNTTGNGGEGGQNLIVSGGGGDMIYASQIADGAEGGHGSIVVAGTTKLSQTALLSILSEWSSTDTLAVKMANITGAPSSLNLNGANYLTPGSTILDDGVQDQIIGNSNGQPDWLLSTFAQDVVTRTKPTDPLTDLG
jgi:Ca2+-binding RTX toxin-like protein